MIEEAHTPVVRRANGLRQTIHTNALLGIKTCFISLNSSLDRINRVNMIDFKFE